MPSTFKEDTKEFIDKRGSLLSLQKKLTKEQTNKIEDKITREQKINPNIKINEDTRFKELAMEYFNNRDNNYMGGILQDDNERYGIKEGGPGIEALRKEAPEVVERMGYEKASNDGSM